MPKGSKVWDDSPIFKTVAGSHLYGTATPESDYDVRGVCHQTWESLLGMSPFEQYQAPAPEDLTIFGLVKFCRLAADCNPNIIEILFAPTEGPTCLFKSPVWNLLVAARSAFVSRKAAHTFSGYAYSQLQRIERHYRWMRDGAPVDPSPLDYGAKPTHSTEQNNEWKWENSHDKNTYQTAREKFRQYTHWLQERNPARKALEERWGYDTKHGMHLVRLMSQGTELLQTGHMTLPRPDAKFLLEIRNGLFTYDEIVAYARSADAEMQAMEKSSDLPFGADRKRIEEMVMDINYDLIRGGL